MAKDPSQEALERFILENPDLMELEKRIAQFNLFEALGAVRQELRHSDLLAFLLNPSGNHGMGDLFLRRFLMEVARIAPDPPVNPLEFDLIAMGEATVSREWRNIDILIHDPSNQMVCLIENKIGSGEHGRQLSRYFETARRHFGAASYFPVYLTPDGEEPSEGGYIPISYEAVADLTESLAETQSSVLGADVKTLLDHYTTMLRRHIVTDSEIADLCRRIYRQHQRALDLIFEHVPDLQQEVRAFLESLVTREPSLELDHCSKTYIRFVPKAWDSLECLRRGSGWTRSRRVLMFQFINSDQLKLELQIGPGPEETRDRLYKLAQSHGQEFRGKTSRLYTKHTKIWGSQVLSKADYQHSSLEDLKPKLESRWGKFIDKECPTLERLISDALSGQQ